MTAVLRGKLGEGWAPNAYAMSRFRMQQDGYPEIEAEGRTPAEACVRLIELLFQAIDFVIEPWRRQPLGLALVDTRSFDRSFSAGASIEPGRYRQPSM